MKRDLTTVELHAVERIYSSLNDFPIARAKVITLEVHRLLKEVGEALEEVTSVDDGNHLIGDRHEH